MFQIQRKFKKLKIFEKKLRIKISVMIAGKTHNFKKMIVDEQRDDFCFLVCYRFLYSFEIFRLFVRRFDE